MCNPEAHQGNQGSYYFFLVGVWGALFILFPVPDLLFPLAALNEMEEVAQEEGEAAGQGQEELPAPSQAVVPMEVDEEQAGNCVWGDITSWYLPEGLIFHCESGLACFALAGLSDFE